MQSTLVLPSGSKCEEHFLALCEVHRRLTFNIHLDYNTSVDHWHTWYLSHSPLTPKKEKHISFFITTAYCFNAGWDHNIIIIHIKPLHFHIFKIKLQYIRITEQIGSGRIFMYQWQKPSLHCRPSPSFIELMSNQFIELSKIQPLLIPAPKEIYIKFKLNFLNGKGYYIWRNMSYIIICHSISNFR